MPCLIAALSNNWLGFTRDLGGGGGGDETNLLLWL